ncbi:MAG: ATP-binding protein [Roseovarius sp.]|nr:ATP-binding protein [Roseovarius sp.]
MATLNALAVFCLLYVALLFCVAFIADRTARRGQGKWLSSPIIYTLSLSIYCTAWTFYGAVGFAASSGLEFLTIYLGPTLIIIGWWWTLRKLVIVGRTNRITSIADLISSRYGKSNLLAVFVTLMAVVGTTPYIALQLQSVTFSIAAFAEADASGDGLPNQQIIAFWVTAGLVVFTILFGTRNLEANARHYGVVMAIALEAVVKLIALLAVGIFAVWGLAGGIDSTLAKINESAISDWEVSGGRWIGLTLLSAMAFICLPRMFQVMVVENENEGHLRTASWAFPLYLMLISLFVVPIAVIGLDPIYGGGRDPDLFVLTLPLENGREGLAILAFLGGFSSATSMVIVAAIALSTMVSNHIVMPVWLWATGGSAIMAGDVRRVILVARRISILVILFLGYLYFRMSGGGAALAAIGLISFVGVAQFMPSLVGGLFWRGGNRTGAIAGLAAGFALWAYCLFLPSFGASSIMPQSVIERGLFDILWLRPQALFITEGMEPVMHAFMWSLSFNILFYVIFSIAGFPTPVERLQSGQFVNALWQSQVPGNWTGGLAQSEDLLLMSQRVLGSEDARAIFQNAAKEQGGEYLPAPTPDFLLKLERVLSGSVGAATANAMISQIVVGAGVSVRDLMAVADETAQIMEYSSRLVIKTEEQERTARQLREVNDKLTRLSVQKDAFLSQISHELRTPMTSIRAFSEILKNPCDISPDKREKFASIIYEEATRLTRLLDELLDLSVLENAHAVVNLSEGRLSELLDRAVNTVASEGDGFKITRNPENEKIDLDTDLDRLVQVFINLISNARKYCDAKTPELEIKVARMNGMLEVDFSDNGSGIPLESQDLIFEKFSRIGEARAGGAGLGLAISREIMTRLGGSLVYLPWSEGTVFRVSLPLEAEIAG